MKKSVLWFVGITGMLLLAHFFLGWMYTNIDGYYYWAFGQYVRTGIYPFVQPIDLVRPTTISPPLYGILLAFLQTFPHPDIILHAIQILMLVATTYLLYRMISLYVKPLWSTLIACLFILFPANIIYVSTMMTEIPAQFLFTVITYLFFRYLRTSNLRYLSTLTLVASIATLLKYQFFILAILSLAFFVVSYIKKSRRVRSHLLLPGMGIAICAAWIIANHAITGVWGLSDTRKMPFYTNFVWDGKYFPKETSPAVQKLRKYVPITANKYAEYWDLQNYILPYFYRDWRVLDDMLGNVGLAAVMENPVGYLMNAARIFYQTHTKPAPWWHNLSTFGRHDPTQPVYCGKLGTLSFCKPMIMTSVSYPVWNAYVRVATWGYNRFFPILSVWLFFPALLALLFSQNRINQAIALLFLVARLPLSFFAFAESRYLIPFYPLMILILVVGLKTLVYPPQNRQ